MENNVVNGLCSALVQALVISFKFNFRGVGRSQGTHSQGIGEQADVGAAISYMADLTEVDSERIGLAGYSAGAGYSLPVGITDIRVKVLAAVSPPLTLFDFTTLKDCPKPAFLISGTVDDFTPVSQFLEFCRELPETVEYHTVKLADHFWRGYEDILSEKVAAFFKGALSR